MFIRNVDQFILTNKIKIIFYTFLILVFTIPLISIRQFRKQFRLRHQQFKDFDIVSAEYSSIGMRQTNEDTILIQNNVKLSQIDQVLINGLFDGHNGPKVSKLAKDTFIQHLQSSFQDLKTNDNIDICNNIVKSFLQFDLSTQNVTGGAASLVTLFTNQYTFVANAGDSRCLCITKDLKHFQQLSTDFKPAINSERKRLEKMGCKVEQSTFNQNGFQIQLGPQRVFPGGLSVSRSFGDWNLKDQQIVKDLIKQLKEGNVSYIQNNKVVIKQSNGGIIVHQQQQQQNQQQQEQKQQQIISAVPEIQYIQNNDTYSILVMGCDGVFDVLSNSDICKIIERNYLQFRIKSLMQVIMRNIDKQSYQQQDDIKNEEFDSLSTSSNKKLNWFQRTGVKISSSIELVQKILQKAKVKYLINYEDESLSQELLLQSDYLCAQMLAKKIVQMALQRESTDNVSVCLSIFRYPSSPKSIQEYKDKYECSKQKKTHIKQFFKKEQSVSEANSDDTYSQYSTNDKQVFISDDDPSKDYYN